MSNLPEEQFEICKNCGYDRAFHQSGNLSDGPFVGKYLLICPTGLFFGKKGTAEYGALRKKE